MGKRGLTSHEELRVRVIIDEQLQLLSRCRQFVHEIGEDDRFRRIGRFETYTVQYHPSASISIQFASAAVLEGSLPLKSCAQGSVLAPPGVAHW